MNPSTLTTVRVVPLGARSPTPLAKATHVPMRSQVSNVGPVVLFVGSASGDLLPEPSVAAYRIIPGEQHVIVLAARQSLYAVGAGTGGLASVANSEALPGDTA